MAWEILEVLLALAVETQSQAKYPRKASNLTKLTSRFSKVVCQIGKHLLISIQKGAKDPYMEVSFVWIFISYIFYSCAFCREYLNFWIGFKFLNQKMIPKTFISLSFFVCRNIISDVWWQFVNDKRGSPAKVQRESDKEFLFGSTGRICQPKRLLSHAKSILLPTDRCKFKILVKLGTNADQSYHEW